MASFTVRATGGWRTHLEYQEYLDAKLPFTVVSQEDEATANAKNVYGTILTKSGFLSRDDVKGRHVICIEIGCGSIQGVEFDGTGKVVSIIENASWTGVRKGDNGPYPEFSPAFEGCEDAVVVLYGAVYYITSDDMKTKAKSTEVSTHDAGTFSLNLLGDATGTLANAHRVACIRDIKIGDTVYKPSPIPYDLPEKYAIDAGTGTIKVVLCENGEQVKGIEGKLPPNWWTTDEGCRKAVKALKTVCKAVKGLLDA